MDLSIVTEICDSFGVHHKLPILKQLYDEKEAIFLAGIGILTTPVNKFNYEDLTKTRLFAHNAGERSCTRFVVRFCNS